MNKLIILSFVCLTFFLALISAQVPTQACVPDKQLYIMGQKNIVNFSDKTYEIYATSPSSQKIDLIVNHKNYSGYQYQSVILDDGNKVVFGAMYGGGGVAAAVYYCIAPGNNSMPTQNGSDVNLSNNNINDKKESFISKVINWFKGLFD